MWYTRGVAWAFPAAWLVYTQVCGPWSVRDTGGRCMLMCGHPGSRRRPEEAEGDLSKAGA